MVRKRATDPKVRENELINLAVDLAEKQLKDGTASSAVITHYIKLASEREKANTAMLKAKAKALEINSGDALSSDEVLEALSKYSPSEGGG